MKTKNKLLALITLMSCSWAPSAISAPRIYCEVGNMTAKAGPGYPHEMRKTEKSSTVATIHLGSFPEIYFSSLKNTGFFQFGTEFDAASLKLYSAKISTRKDIATITNEQVLNIQKENPSSIDHLVRAEIYPKDHEIYFIISRRYNPLNERIGLDTITDERREVAVKFENFGKPHVIDGFNAAIVCRGRAE